MWAAIQLLMMKLMAILAAHREWDASGDGSPRGSRPAHNEPPPGPSPPPGPQMEEAVGHLHLEWNAGYPVAPAQFIPCILHGGHFQTQPMCQWPGWPGWGSMVPAPMVTVPAPNESCCPPDHRLEEDTAPAPMPGSVDLTGDDDKKTDDPAAHPNGKEAEPAAAAPGLTLGLRPCNRCQQVAYCGKGICANVQCDPWPFKFIDFHMFFASADLHDILNILASGFALTMASFQEAQEEQ